MRRRHEVLLKFLTEILRIEFFVADEEACKMEHALSPETLDRFTDFIEFIEECPRTGESWLNYFEAYRRDGCLPEKCQVRSEGFTCQYQDPVEGNMDDGS